jgi:hypothetical protein
MRKLFIPSIFIFFFGFISPSQVIAQQEDYIVSFSTYLGGSDQDILPDYDNKNIEGYEGVRDITTDNDGNIYVTGGTSSLDFPRVPPTIGEAYHTGICPPGHPDPNDSTCYCDSFGSAGSRDVFITKYSPTGQIIWSRLLGGSCYDRAYAIEVDDNQNVYVGGRAGDNFPVTQNAFQAQFMKGEAKTHYGYQDAFVAKISPDGQEIIFATYFGSRYNDIFRDIDITSTGEVYGVGNQGDEYSFPDTHSQYRLGVIPSYTPYVESKFVNGASGGSHTDTDAYLVKISSDGSVLLWARHIAGSSDDGMGPAVRVDDQDYPYVYIGTKSYDLQTIPTPGAYQEYLKGPSDIFLAKVEKDGSGLIYATYLGGTEGEGGETHNLEVNASGYAIFSGGTWSSDYPIYPTGPFPTGVYQQNYAGGPVSSNNWKVKGDVVISVLSADGTQLLSSTYMGGRFGEGGEGVAVDDYGNVYVSGHTYSDDFPTNAGPPPDPNTGPHSGDTPEAIAFKISGDLKNLIYSRYMGDSGTDAFRAIAVDSNNNILLGGVTDSRSWPLVNAHQTAYGGGNGDAVVVKLSLAKPSWKQMLSNWLTSTNDQNGDGKVNSLDWGKMIVTP